MFNNFKLCQTHFSWGDEKFSKGASSPWLRACLTQTINHDFRISLHSVASLTGEQGCEVANRPLASKLYAINRVPTRVIFRYLL